MTIKFSTGQKSSEGIGASGDASVLTAPVEPAVVDSGEPAANDGPVSPWQFTPKGDGLDLQRYALQYLDAHKPKDWEYHLRLATHAGLPLDVVKEWAAARGHPKHQIVEMWVAYRAGYISAVDRENLVRFAVKFGMSAAKVTGTVSKPVFVFHSGDTYAKDFVGPPELVEDVLPARGVAMVYGKSGSGKTFWVLDMAFHIHNGQQWRDRDVNTGNVFYIAAEAGQGVRKRLHGVRVLHPDWHAPFVADMAPNLSSDESVAAVQEAILAADAPPALVIIDTFSASFEGDDSSQKDVAAVVRKLKTLADSLQCLVLFVHHPTKAGDSPRGSGVLMNDVDAWIEISTEGEGSYRTHVAMVGKVRDGEAGARYPFRLRKSNPLATKANGGFITTCTVEHLGAMPVQEKLSETLKLLQPVFTEMSLEGPVLFGPLLKATQAKHGSGKVKRFNACRDVAKKMGIEEKDITDETLVWI
jgi:KaiC/GvpD/RAD55 family RecA-like ATPase